MTGSITTAGDPLNVRRAPTTSSTVVGTVNNGTEVSIDCQTQGTRVSGRLGTTSLWDYVPSLNGYVSDAYVRTGSDGQVAPSCGVGTGSAQCSSGSCAGEGLFRSSDATFVVWDRAADGKSAVVQYWLAGGVGPLVVRHSGGSGGKTEKAISVDSGDWVYYKVCVRDYSGGTGFQSCSNGITDYAA
ncbi:SH3 domain-containing protein [Amycolatopsis marina]|uniref:SH3 domain-containing protein n=1 Tax=Amycolatopsis marina TaxID=490629 RepID=A0A1I0WTK3_9PSEU|nr:SH3 domain-containing protein [Amycolatopsis marina]SFA92065.1 SH3 domain-containing protein [Amycolatopsis marina]